jgi:hypothetical protein
MALEGAKKKKTDIILTSKTTAKKKKKTIDTILEGTIPKVKCFKGGKYDRGRAGDMYVARNAEEGTRGKSGRPETRKRSPRTSTQRGKMNTQQGTRNDDGWDRNTEQI